jgi:hypothetical protein
MIIKMMARLFVWKKYTWVLVFITNAKQKNANLPQRVGPTYCQFDARVERDSEIICASF